MTPWGRAITALRLLERDPGGLGGIVVHARSGPVRDAFLALLPPTATRLHPAMSPETLTGGVDVAASLTEGALIHQLGLLHRDGPVLLGMAERTPPLMAATLAAWRDANPKAALILCDEHGPDEPPPPIALTDRIAFHISLDGISRADIEDFPVTEPHPGSVTVSEATVEDIVHLAVSLGITSLRAPTLALSAAKAHAALSGRDTVTQDDIIAAAELVLAPRATRLPQEPPEDNPPPTDEEREEDPDNPASQTLPDEIVLAAIATALPPDLLGKTDSNMGKSARGSGAGQRRIGNRRGRPLPARDTGARSSDARVDLMATLRAAVPWQKLRHSETLGNSNPIIHPSDLRYRRYEDLSDRLLVFAVDASGSAALARLAEAKGAVELLLAEAYARRDHVALISFRGTEAETLLPPTRSLVQTKRRLAALPGGGATPLASGLHTALETAVQSQRKGLSPVLILLTDGRSNIALNGAANREEATRDATRIANQIARAGIDSIVIDTGRRPETALRQLSASLRGRYVSLPRADARKLSDTVADALSG